MNVKRYAYNFGWFLGRVVASAVELVIDFWPVQATRVALERDYNKTLPERAASDPRTDGVNDDLDWPGWAIPAIAEVLVKHAYVGLRSDPDKGACDCNRSVELSDIDWVDHVASIIADRCACDPATAIAALWNYQLKQGMTS
jgi:hypothetical protein